MFSCLKKTHLSIINVQRSFLIALIVCVQTFSITYAQNSDNKNTQYQRSLNKVTKEINNISKRLNNNKAQLKTERHALFKIEKELTKNSKKLANTEFELAKNEHELNALELKIKQVARSQKNNRNALKDLLIQRYQNGRPNYLKNLLNQENPYAVGRLANYQQYFSKAFNQRKTNLAKLASEAATLKEKKTAIVNQLTLDKQTQKQQLALQKKNKEQRQKSINKLNKQVSTNSQTLAKLKKDRSRLDTLLQQLKKQANELKRLEEQRRKQAEELARKNNKTTPIPAKPRVLVKGGFKKQKGRLNYPVQGKLTRQYGRRLAESGMRSEGHFFATQGSVNVRTIFRGRVLFADFLKGYGLLIIVDHGDDHISLYGHNERLLKSVGDEVTTNEIIAKSGVTGGLKSHGLYFEIRNNTAPVDPSKWCQ